MQPTNQSAPTAAQSTIPPPSGACEAELQAQLQQRRSEAAADPQHRRREPRAKSLTFDEAAARFLSPASIAEGERRRALYAAHEREQEEARREAAWRSFVERRGSRYESATLDNFAAETPQQREVLARMKRYRDELADNVKAGIGLLLYGPVGTGKDHLVIELVKRLIAAGGSVAWMNGGDLFGMFRDGMDEDEKERVLVERLVRPDVLYLSDPLPPLGELGSFRREVLYRVIDARYSRCRPLWVTMNVKDGGDLDSRMGLECSTRLRHGAVALFCNWPCFRKVAQ